MRKSLVTILALALAGVVYSVVDPAPAYCASCSTVPCSVSSQCNVSCSCMKSGSDSFGTCVSFD